MTKRKVEQIQYTFQVKRSSWKTSPLRDTTLIGAAASMGRLAVTCAKGQEYPAFRLIKLTVTSKKAKEKKTKPKRT